MREDAQSDQLLPSTGADDALVREFSLSTRMWGISWGRYFPKEVAQTGIVAEYVSYEEFLEFVMTNYSEIYKNEVNQHKILVDNTLDAIYRRSTYYKLVGDFFLFKDAGKAIGSFCSTVFDWRTYYLRSSGLLPEYQGKGIYKRFLDMLLHCLDIHGVDCVNADVSPSNLPVLNVLNKRKFNITGSLNSDQYGALVNLTRFLNADSEVKFLDRFCIGVYPQLNRKFSRGSA